MKEYNNEKAVISLTSWKNRINTVEKTIDNLYNACPGFHICLTLSETEFPRLTKDLPDSLMERYNKDMFEIIWIHNNLKCYKKIIYAMQKYPEVPIISADDDCLYQFNYAEELYNNWEKNKKRIYSYRVDKNSKPLRFQDGPCALYPPGVFNNVFFKYLYPNILNTWHDDIYNGILAYKMGIPIIEVNPNPPYIHHDETDALCEGVSANGAIAVRECLETITISQKVLGIVDCGPQVPIDPNSSSLGGSETWIQETAKAFSNMNWHVVVFANVAGKYIAGNIEYIPLNEIGIRCKYQKFDKFIFSRGLCYTNLVDCDDKCLFLHDTELARVGNARNATDLFKFNTVYVLSEYGKECFKKIVPSFPDDKIKISFNGIYYEPYQHTVEKTNSMVWSSCKERGFDFFKQYVVPHIRKEIPDFTTYVCSYNTIDVTSDESLGIKYVGKLNKTALAELQLGAKIWCYPNLGHLINAIGKDVDFGETFCISAVENYAAGNIIIAGDMGGIKTTLCDYPLLGKEFYNEQDWITEDKYEEYGKYLADYCVKALKGEWRPTANIPEYTWTNAGYSLL